MSQAASVLEPAPQAIRRLSISRKGGPLSFVRSGSTWRVESTGAEVPPALSGRLNEALKLLHTAPPVRRLLPEETAGIEAAVYGLDPPAFSVELSSTAGPVLLAHFGGRATDGILQFARLEGDDETLLMSGFVGEAWQSVIDYD